MLSRNRIEMNVLTHKKFIKLIPKGTIFHEIFLNILLCY